MEIDKDLAKEIVTDLLAVGKYIRDYCIDDCEKLLTDDTITAAVTEYWARRRERPKVTLAVSDPVKFAKCAMCEGKGEAMRITSKTGDEKRWRLMSCRNCDGTGIAVELPKGATDGN